MKLKTLIKATVLTATCLLSSQALAGARHTGNPRLELVNNTPREVTCYLVAPNRQDPRRWSYAGKKLVAGKKQGYQKPGKARIARTSFFDDRSFVCFHTADWKGKNAYNRPWPGQQKIGSDWYVWTDKPGSAGDRDTVRIACRGARLSCNVIIERNTH